MTIFSTRGLSMLPAILPGSRLEVTPLRSGRIRLGDVVCYPGGHNVMIAHRVVDITGDHRLVVRGDAQTDTEEIEPSAIAMKALRVVGSVYSYRIDGPLGRLFKRLALKDGMPWRLSRLGLASGIVRLSSIKRRLSFKKEVNYGPGRMDDSGRTSVFAVERNREDVK